MISGALPLFICEDHWKIAKLLMKPLLGWAVTLDPLGYTYSQVKTIPFMILAKLQQMLCENPSSKFKSLFEHVKETCKRIMKGEKNYLGYSFAEEVADLFYNYTSYPILRTIDAIPHNAVFLAQVYIGIENGQILWEKSAERDTFEEFFRAMVEEELRRKQRWLDDKTNITHWLINLLNIDEEKYITPKVTQAVFELGLNPQDYRMKFLSVYRATNQLFDTDEPKEESSAINFEDTKEESEAIDSQKTKVSYTQAQKEALDEYKQVLRFIMRYLYPMRKLFLPEENMKDPALFMPWGINTPKKFFTLYIQNKLHSRNYERRQAIIAGKYRDPRTQSDDFIKTVFNQAINDEVTKRVNAKKRGGERADIFRFTDDLNEAAGALMDASLQYSLMTFAESLMHPRVPYAHEKLKMLLTGEFKGVPLMTKSFRKYWAGKKTVHKIYLANPHNEDCKHFVYKV